MFVSGALITEAALHRRDPIAEARSPLVTQIAEAAKLQSQEQAMADECRERLTRTSAARARVDELLAKRDASEASLRAAQEDVARLRGAAEKAEADRMIAAGDIEEANAASASIAARIASAQAEVDNAMAAQRALKLEYKQLNKNMGELMELDAKRRAAEEAYGTAVREFDAAAAAAVARQDGLHYAAGAFTLYDADRFIGRVRLSLEAAKESRDAALREGAATVEAREVEVTDATTAWQGAKARLAAKREALVAATAAVVNEVCGEDVPVCM